MISVGSHLVSHLPVGKLIGEVLANWQVELQCERIPEILVFKYSNFRKYAHPSFLP